MKVTKAVSLITIDWFSPSITAAPGASILIDGEVAASGEVDLSEGEVLLASGEFDPNTNTLTADHIESSHTVDGPLDEVDLVHGELVVLGQTVIVEGRTVIDGGDLAGYRAGDRLTISGHPSSSGQVVATHIKPSPRTGDFLGTGLISSVNENLHQLTLGSLVVDYGTAVLSNFNNSALAAGSRVRVKGTRTDSAATLMATSIERVSQSLPGASGVSVSLGGVVTSTTSSAVIEVDGYPVALSAAGQASCTSLPGPNARVTVSGLLQADGGAVVADSFCFDDLSGVKTGLLISGPIDAVDSAFGAISVLGFAIQSSLTTHVVDQAGSTIPFASLKAGDFVTASGSGGPAEGVLLTWRAERMVSPASASVKAFWGEGMRMADPYVFVVGRAIAIDAHTSFAGFGVPMTPEIFFGDPQKWGITGVRMCPPNFEFSVAELFDPNSATFKVTGSLSAPLSGHMAFLIPGDAVLVFDAYPTFAEIYHVTARDFTPFSMPQQPQFVAAGSPFSAPRFTGTVTQLRDGQLLFLGGQIGGDPVDTAVLLNPVTGTVTNTVSLKAPRTGHTATLLDDGRVLLIGGTGPAGSEIPPFEYWSPTP
jgi:hypothetical protein